MIIASWMPFLPDEASSVSAEVDALYTYLVIITIFFSTLIFVSIVYFAIKYRRRSKNEIPAKINESKALEITWTVIPFLLAMTMFVWGSSLYFKEYYIPKNAEDIYVVAKQWMWKFQHPEGQREINELHIPVGRKIKLIMASEDVIHSFFVPAFRLKEDVVPGPKRYSMLSFEATRPGRYHLFCAEYCGTNHAGMIGWVNVMRPEEYESWLSEGAAEGSMAASGEKMFQDLGCVTCHRADAQGRGPVLQGLFGKTQTLANGETVIADENYIRESILDPQAKVVSNFQPIMPNFKGQISEEQLLQLVAYIKSLGGP